MLFFLGCETTTHQPHPKKHKEKYYQKKLCKKLKGIMEYRLKDKTRVDCLTDEYAIEVDFAKKWAEGIGQSLYYGYMTNRQPAVGLICSKKDKRFLNRLKTVAKKENIKIFVIEK
jgi:hypothetical protein